MVRLFTFMAQDAGSDRLELTMDTGTPLHSTLAAFRAANPHLRWPAGCLIAVNQEYVPMTHHLRDGDEVAIIPPVSGGEGRGVESHG